MIKTIVVFGFKLAVTLGCLYLIWQNIDHRTALMHLQALSPWVFGFCVLLFLSQLYPIALRWGYFSAHLGTPLKVATALRLVAMGHFLNQAFLGTIAGDAARTGYLVQHGASLGRAAGSIILDRYVALLMIWVAAVMAAPLLWRAGGEFEVALALAAFLTVIGCVLATLPLAGWLVQIRHLSPDSRLGSFIRFVGETARVFLETIKQRQSWGVVYGSSIYVLVSSAIITWILAIGMGMEIGAGTVFAITPVALLFSAVPISIGGWGVREMSFASLMMLSGGTSEAGLALSVLFGLASLVSGLICGLAWIVSKVDTAEA